MVVIAHKLHVDLKTHNKRLHADLVWKTLNNFQELANIQNHPESRLQN